MNCTIVMYHYTRDLKHSRYPEIKGLDIPLFRQQLEFFKANYNVIRMEQLIAAVKFGEPLPEKALLLTFDDGYIDNYTFALPLLEEFGFQGSFFIPGKTFTTHQLLDVNKIHYILASTDAETLMESLLNHLNFYRGTEFDYPSNDELFEKYAVANRFDPKEIRFIKRVLQTGIPEAARNKITSDLFKKHVGISEEQLHEDALRSSALILPARMETAESIRKRAASLDVEDFSDDPEADDAVDFGGGSADAEGPSYLMLTNEQRTFGASVVLYPGVLDMAAEELGGDVYLIPSSVNEFILVPVSLVPEAEELEASISYVNETLVAPSEILSKRLYHYDFKTKRLEFAIQYLVQ